MCAGAGRGRAAHAPNEDRMTGDNVTGLRTGTGRPDEWATRSGEMTSPTVG